MKRVIILILLIISLNSLDSYGKEERFRGKCLRVIDGDTIEVLKKGNKEKIRLASIDAPEKNQEYGIESREYLKGLILNATIEIVTRNKDIYNRYIGEIFLNGCNINNEMVRSGNAWIYTYYIKDKRVEVLETEAIMEGRGLWGLNPVPPWEFRKEKKETEKP